MTNNVVKTIYQSSKFESKEKVIPFSELLPSINLWLKSFCSSNSIVYNSEENTIIFNKTHIVFNLYYSSSVRRYFLSFIPKNVWTYSSKKILEPAFLNTIKFFVLLNSQIRIMNIDFAKCEQSNIIDISSWKYRTVFDHQLKSLSELDNNEIKRILNGVFEKSHKIINQQLLVINATSMFDKHLTKSLGKQIRPLFKLEPEIIKYDSSISIEMTDQRIDKNNLFVLFIGNQNLFDSCYLKFKQYFISNSIPSQFISIEKLQTTLSFGLSNFVFEILKKSLNQDSILLEPPHSDVDGYLCLSDVGTVDNQKLFGVSFSFTGRGNTDDFVEIYNDIQYQTKYERIYFGEGQLQSLARKIEILSSLSNKKIDIFLSRRWNTKDVGYFASLLEERKIFPNKIYYYANKANRFIIEDLIDENNLFTHPFIIWDQRAASIQTNSKLQLYGTMFPIYLEILNPWNEHIMTENDVANIIWLVKKRIYRLNNFYNLKAPEVISLFKDIQKLHLENITDKFKISVHNLL